MKEPSIEKQKIPNWLIILLGVFTLSLFIFAVFLYLQKYQLKKQNLANPIASWKTFESTDKKVSFKYPPQYQTPVEYDNYISLLSPLSPTRGKGYELQNDELKVEIYFSQAEPGETLTDFVRKKREQSLSMGTNLKILEENEVIINGVTAIRQTWEGIGTGESFFLLKDNREIGIIKYPAKTNRESEFDDILSTVRFLDESAEQF